MSNQYKNKKQKQSKQIKVIHEDYINGIKYLFRHPSSLFYVVVCKDNYVKIFDLPTMSITAQTQLRMQITVTIRKCVFMLNCNQFYTLTNNWGLMHNEVNKNGSILVRHEQLSLEPEITAKILQVSQTANEDKQFIVLLTDGFLICSASTIKKFISFHSKILKGFDLISCQTNWIIFTQKYCSLLYLRQDQINGFVENSELLIKLPESPRFFFDYKKKLVAYIDEENNICVLNCNQIITMVMRVKREEEKSLEWISFLHFGVGTSTTFKYENKVVVLVGYEEIEEMMIEEKRENPPNFQVFAYSLEIEKDEGKRRSLSVFQRDYTCIKDFKSVQMIWYCEYMENKMSYLSWNGQFQTADLCRLLEGKNTASEWVNLGYKFQALDSNEIYEQVQSEFDGCPEEKQRGLRKLQLDDWSYCIFPKQIIKKKKLERINCFQF